MLYPDIFDRIKEAKEILKNVVHRTPLTRSYTFSKLTGGNIYLKLENLQKTGSFKARGAYNKLWHLVKAKGIRECITASSGNHAQGVAYAATLLGVKSTIVMPKYTPVIKVVATKGYGANVILYGRTYDDAYEYAVRLSKERNIDFIHAFNDPYIIAGQGTIGLEIYEDLPNIDAVVVPIGGGGLISGIAIALKNLKPNVKVYGVEASGAPSMKLSLEKGEIVKVRDIDTIADGIAIKSPGDLTFKIVSEIVDDVLLVDDDEIVRAMFMLLERCKLVAEPAGAVGVAAVLSGKIDVREKNVAIVVSGGNVDMPLLSRVIDKALVVEGREIRIRGVLNDRPGTLKEVLESIAKARANVISIEEDRVSPTVKIGKVEVTITLEVPDKESIDEILKDLKGKGYSFKVVD